MKRNISIGGLEKGAFFAEKLELPILDSPPAMTWLHDAVDQAATERKGVAIVGEKGTGKSVALDQAIEEFREVEREVTGADAIHQRRRIFKILSSRDTSRRETLGAIWKAVLGMEMRGVVRGKKRDDSDLQSELIEQLLQQRVAVLAFDEAELLSDDALSLIRDLISEAEQTSKERYRGDAIRAAGIGVVLVGTPEFAERIHASQEAGHRWLRVKEVEGLTVAEAAEVYVAYLPAFAAHVEDVGEAKWRQYLKRQVFVEKFVAIRRIENHVRNYVRRFVAEDPDAADLEMISFDEDLFEYTLSELAEYRPPDDD